jgi:hypothetical protein
LVHESSSDEVETKIIPEAIENTDFKINEDVTSPKKK